jgi:hypothetical protein
VSCQSLHLGLPRPGLEAVTAHTEPVTTGSHGQIVTHPLLAEIRQHHQLIAQLLARLDLDAGDDDGAVGITAMSPGLRSVKARAAAQKRWRGSN